MTKIVSWNIAGRVAPWHSLLEMCADIALLQEARQPPPEVAAQVEIDPSPWGTAGAGLERPWKAAVVKMSDRVQVEWIESKSIPEAGYEELSVSRPGTLAAAKVTPSVGEPFVVVSMYAAWEQMHHSAHSDWIYADGSAHRIISDLARLIGHEIQHRIVAAGDLNILYGYGEHGDKLSEARYATVFDRMAAIGLPFVGPRHPGGRQADPWPDELPRDSGNVPTYHHNRQSPVTATRQLDFVFASRGMVNNVDTCALNDPDEWGPSDHCRILIEVL